MQSWSAQQLLFVWEQGAAEPSQRALALLDAAFPEKSRDDLSALSVGARDGMLFHVRQRLFGSRVTGVAACKKCNEPLELTFEAGGLAIDAGDAPAESFTYTDGAYELELRLPNSADLAAIKDLPDIESARKRLLERCVVSARLDGEPVSVDRLSSAVVDGIAARMDEIDPLANVRIQVSCPHCGHEFEAVIDIESFLWAEVQAWAKRTLLEVHRIAAAYGWSEAEILGMSARRRQSYLSLIGT